MGNTKQIALFERSDSHSSWAIHNWGLTTIRNHDKIISSLHNVMTPCESGHMLVACPLTTGSDCKPATSRDSHKQSDSGSQGTGFLFHKDGPDKRSNASREPSHLAQRTCQMVIQTLSSITLIEQADPFAEAWQMEVARAELLLAKLTESEQISFITGLKATIDACGDNSEWRLFAFITFNNAFERKA